MLVQRLDVSVEMIPLGEHLDAARDRTAVLSVGSFISTPLGNMAPPG